MLAGFIHEPAIGYALLWYDVSLCTSGAMLLFVSGAVWALLPRVCAHLSASASSLRAAV